MMQLPMAGSSASQRMPEDERQVTVGLGFCHNQINLLAQRLIEAGTEAGAVARSLLARGLITEEDLALHRAGERERIEEALNQDDFGIAISSEFPDKYTIAPEAIPSIDCEDRYHLCHGACCALRFALSTQDLDEAVVRWELGRPYIIRHGTDGRCVHQERDTLHCAIYEKRPGVCRVYDCRKDTRIWTDFEQRVVNPKLFATMPDGSLRPQFPEPLRRDATGSTSAPASMDGSC
jgi:Fe-S-cluster containining protein